MTDIEVRLYEESDLERVLELADEFHRELYARFGKEARLEENTGFYQNAYLNPQGHYTVLVASTSDGIEGYIVGSSPMDMPELNMHGPRDPESVSWTEMDILFTTASSRGRGVGKALVTAMCDYVREHYGHEEISGYVANWNEPSLRVLRSLGFDEEAEDSRVLFSKEL